MREIKFRAWHTEIKNLQQPFTLQEAIGSRKVNGVDTTDVIYMQFTGFKDIHGTEVYEGDVLAWPDDDADNRNNDPMPVVWDAGGFTLDGSAIWDYAVWTKHKDGRIKDPTNELEALEVVGNIYENPELIR